MLLASAVNQNHPPSNFSNSPMTFLAVLFGLSMSTNRLAQHYPMKLHGSACSWHLFECGSKKNTAFTSLHWLSAASSSCRRAVKALLDSFCKSNFGTAGAGASSPMPNRPSTKPRPTCTMCLSATKGEMKPQAKIVRKVKATVHVSWYDMGKALFTVGLSIGGLREQARHAICTNLKDWCMCDTKAAAPHHNQNHVCH